MLRFSRSYAKIAAATSESMYKPFDSIPGPKTFPLIGSLPYYISGKYDPHDVLKSGIIKYHEFGPIVKERIFNNELIFLYDPTDIETLFRQGSTIRRSHLSLGHMRQASEDHANGGILYENNSTWSALRSASQHSLTTEAFEQFLPKLDEFTLRFVDNIETDSVTRKVIDKDFLLALLAHQCDSMCYILFGFEWESMQNIFDNDAVTTRAIHSSTYINRMMHPMDAGLRLWKYFPTPLYTKLKKCSEDVDFLPKREVSRRFGKPSLAQGPGILNSWIREGRLDHKTVMTLLSDLLLAGIDTTSYTLSFALYLLSVNKRVQDKLFGELSTLLPDPNERKPMSSEKFGRATYLKRVVKESMRLFPVSVGTSRVLDKSCVIGGYEIPPNVTFVTMNQVTCRLEDYVERPSEFIPERYEPDSGFKKIRPYTALPFGHGPRACIGRRIAEQSMYLFLFRLLRRYEIQWTGDKPLGCVAHSITEPDSPLMFRFNRRNL